MKTINGTFTGYLRQDGRKGIRNQLLVCYLVECARFVATEMAYPFKDKGVQVVGFSGCYPNDHANKIVTQLCTHPNVGGVLLVSLGCESFNRNELMKNIKESGRPVDTIVIQASGGTSGSIKKGKSWLTKHLEDLKNVPKVEMSLADLTIGTICGGSDATSGLTANPAVGLAFDKLEAYGSTVIFEETGEMIGCFDDLLNRVKDQELKAEIKHILNKAAEYYTTMGYGSFAPGNADGGLSTIEEKSLGAYSKGGSAPITGLIKPGDVPVKNGLFLLDVVPDGEPRFGFPNINDNVEITELIASGCQLILFTTGRGSVVGSAVSPVIKICSNPETYKNMSEDMDINAGKVLQGLADLEEVSDEIIHHLVETAEGKPTASENLGHQECVITYKTFEPLGPGCFPK